MGIDEQHYVGILYMDCSFCESGNIKKGIPENYGETIEVNCLCNECGKEWSEIYNFSMSILGQKCKIYGVNIKHQFYDFRSI